MCLLLSDKFLFDYCILNIQQHTKSVIFSNVFHFLCFSINLYSIYYLDIVVSHVQFTY